MGAQTDQSPPCLIFNALRVHFFGRIQERICDLSSFGSWYIKGTNESFSRVDSSVPLMHHDPNDLRSPIHFWILPKNTLLIFIYWVTHWNVGHFLCFSCCNYYTCADTRGTRSSAQRSRHVGSPHNAGTSCCYGS